MELDKAKLRATIALLRREVEIIIGAIGDLEAIMDGQATTGTTAAAALEEFGRLWSAKYRTPYVVGNRVAILATMKRVLRAGVSGPELRNRMAKYLLSTDPFYLKGRHPLTVFLANVNAFAADALPLTSAAVGCAHVPPCPSDAAHTRKTQAELRGR